jgi:hypothetical protein
MVGGGGMSKVDWNDAPDGAIALGKAGVRKNLVWVFKDGYQYVHKKHGKFLFSDVGITFRQHEIEIISVRPTVQQWPDDEDRIDVVAQNGNTGEHYAPTHPVTAVEFLNACVAVQSERGQQYDPNGKGERSFAAAAVAFTALTGKPLVGSDICLIIELVKKVRQYSKPDRIHHDSLLDSVSYDSLWAAELIKELSK